MDAKNEVGKDLNIRKKVMHEYSLLLELPDLEKFNEFGRLLVAWYNLKNNNGPLLTFTKVSIVWW